MRKLAFALLVALGAALPASAQSQSVAAYQPGWIGQTMVVRGTVSRFVQRDVNGEPYVYLYFKERPDSTVVACSRDDRWLLGVLGVADFQSIVGKTFEFSGEIVKGTCTEQGASLWIWQRNQARVVAAPTPPAQTRGAPAPSQPSASSTPSVDLAAALGPTLVWHPEKERPATVLKSDIKLIGPKKPDGYDGLFGEAVCSKNGVSVNFKLLGSTEPGPSFESYENSGGEGFVDVDVSIDDQYHVAKGFLNIEGVNLYVNSMGVLFYEPTLAARAPGERRLEARTGTELDRLIGPLVTAATEAEIAEGLRTSAGPLTDLVKARSILLRVPIHEGYQATVEMNPQEPTLHAFATRCLAGFGAR